MKKKLQNDRLKKKEKQKINKKWKKRFAGKSKPVQLIHLSVDDTSGWDRRTEVKLTGNHLHWNISFTDFQHFFYCISTLEMRNRTSSYI